MLTVLILPIACFFIYYTFAKSREDFADSLAKTILTYEVLILLMANLLSINSMLDRLSVFCFWLLTIAITVLIGATRYKKEYFNGLFSLSVMKEKVTECKAFIKALTIAEKLMMAAGLVVLVILLVGALFTVPYNYDSMTYHLSRIGYWMDHGNVNYYVTNVDRQLFSPVLAEYNLLAVMLLCKNDVLLNLQQYLAMLMTAYYLYRISRMLGTSRPFSLLSAFAYLTMPLTITQAITTQNDLSAGLFFALFVYELMWFIQAKPEDFGGRQLAYKSIRIGMTVGFAFLMKVSICASMIMFMPWVVIVCLKRKDKIISLLKAAMCAGISMLIVIAETLIRTYQACGSFMADTTSGDIMVATKNVSYIIVNILKNYSLLITQHLWTWLNGVVYRFAINTGARLHVEVNNIAISYHGFDFIKYLNFGDDMYSHDRTPSAFVSYLALLAGILMVVALIRYLIWWLRNKSILAQINEQEEKAEVFEKKPYGQTKVCFGYVISAWLGFGFIMALLRWQPWGSRLMYPALTMTVVASMHMLDVFCNKLKNKGWIILPLAVLSLLLCIRPIQYNMTQAIDYLAGGCQDRLQHYFVHNDRSQAYYELLDIAKEKGATDIAVVISGDGYDYPLWKIFHEVYPKGELRHIIVDDMVMESVRPGISGKEMQGVNITGKNAQGMAKTYDNPDCILWIERGRLEVGQTLDFFGTTYECIFTSDSEKAPDSILVRRDTY